MVEEIALPSDFVETGMEAFPVFNGGSEIGRWWDVYDRVEMVGHQKEDSADPGLVFVVVRGGVEEGVAGFRAAKVIFLARFAVDGDEIIRIGADPIRNRVGKTLAIGMVHCRGKFLSECDRNGIGELSGLFVVRSDVLGLRVRRLRSRRAGTASPYLWACSKAVGGSGRFSVASP